MFGKNKKKLEQSQPEQPQPPKPLRSTAEIKAEYANLVGKAGQLQYAISEQQRDLTMTNLSLRDLSLEFTASDNAEKAKAAAEAQAAKPADASLEVAK